MSENNVCEAVSKWQSWAKNADQLEDGWQSNYPEWPALMQVCEQSMKSENLDSKQLSAIEVCWKISEESEQLADFASKNVNTLYPLLERLSHSKYPEVRWQVYSILPTAGKKSEGLIREGTSDTDAYVKRRALIALASLEPDDKIKLANMCRESDDPYINQLADLFVKDGR